MKKPLIVLLAVLAGLTGLAVGILTARRAPTVLAGGSKNSLKAAAAKNPGAGPASADVKVIRFASNGLPMPAFLVRDLDGNIISTADWPGKVVLLNFWATWCPPCRIEIPSFIELQKKYKDEGFLIVGISLDDAPAEEVKEFAKAVGMNYPIVMRSRELVSEYGGVPALPTSFLINKEARVVQKHEGLFSSALYEAEIRALLGLHVDAKIETFEDHGQIFLKNAIHATELPDVDFSGMNPVQKSSALKRLNSEVCNCGCGLTLAQCRILDTACGISKDLADKIVKDVLAGGSPPSNALAPNP